MASPVPVFDGHNDILSKLAGGGVRAAADRFRQSRDTHIDVERARRGGFAGGLFAAWVPSSGVQGVDFAAMADARFNVPLPPPVPQPDAVAAVALQAGILHGLRRAGLLAVCRTVAEIEAAMAEGTIAAVLNLEGAEAIGRDLAELDLLHAAGLRSLGPVWSRPNRFGHGVPFRFPSPPDTGPGLTEDGLRLVDRCGELKIVVDVSHLTEAGFWDVARRSRAPLVASHSNAHALCAAARNLTDRQLAAIRESGGLVGVNFATAFLRADGRMLADVPLDRVIAHLDHLLAHLGEDGVALGSDYDGALVPTELNGVEGLPRLVAAMERHGYGAELIGKITSRNWLRVLRATWGA
jgi:membrane dipeptidase